MGRKRLRVRKHREDQPSLGVFWAITVQWDQMVVRVFIGFWDECVIGRCLGS